jgi:protein TIF31
MKAEKYDEKNARAHIKRVKDILSTPQLLSSTPSQIQLPTTVASKPEGGEQEEAKATSQYEEKLKKSYEDFMSIVERESKKEIPMPPSNKSGPQQQQSLIKELFLTTPSIESEMNKVQHVKCVDSISFSGFNPVPPYRRMVGDLFYLVVKTLDSGEHGITCNVNGFYRNDCIERGNFAPGPSTHRNPCYSYTLVGTIHQLSPSFGKNLEKYFNSILATEPYFLTQIPLTSSQSTSSWLIPESKQMSQTQHSQDDATLTPLYGLDPRGVREWNEEFQVVKDFPKETFMQRIQRDRAVQKVYNDFLEAAVKGAVALIGGNLTPLNPNEAAR